MNKSTMAMVGIGGFSIGSTILGLISFVSASKKLKKAASKIDESVSDISTATKVEISEAIVNKAVEEAVNTQAEKQVTEATERIVADVERDKKAQIRKEIDGIYSDMKGDVRKEVDRKIGLIDITAEKRTVLDDAQRKVEREFKDDLDRIMKDVQEHVYDLEKDYKRKLDDSMKKMESEQQEFLRQYKEKQNSTIGLMSDVYGDVQSFIKGRRS